LGDQHQDFLEHLSRHLDLGHLKGRVAAVADDLGADLDQLLGTKEFFTELWRAAVSKSLPLRHQGTHRAPARPLLDWAFLRCEAKYMIGEEFVQGVSGRHRCGSEAGTPGGQSRY
jgi:hypothetical protein